MGSFISTASFVELPFRKKRAISFGNTISFDNNVSDEEIINTIIKSNCDRIQTTTEPSEEEITILDKIYAKNPNIGFRLYSIFGPDADLSFLLKIKSLRNLYLDCHSGIKNIELLKELKLDLLSLSCFSVKNYSFLKDIDCNLKSLSIDLEDKTYKMDINDILHIKCLENLEIRNVKKGLDKICEFKKLNSLLLRSIDIKDYRFLNNMNVRKLNLCFQKSEYFNTFGINEKIEEINLWRCPKLTDLSFLLQFPNLRKITIRDQAKVTSVPDLKALKKLEEVYYFCNNDPELSNSFNNNVKIYTWYNPCDED